MRTRLLTAVLLVALTACSKDKDKQAEGKSPTGTTSQATQTTPAQTPPPSGTETAGSAGPAGTQPRPDATCVRFSGSNVRARPGVTTSSALQQEAPS